MKKIALVAALGMGMALAGCSKPAETTAEAEPAAAAPEPAAVDTAAPAATDTAAAPEGDAATTDQDMDAMSDNDRGNDGGRRTEP